MLARTVASIAFALALAVPVVAAAQPTPQPVPTEPPHVTLEALEDFIGTQSPAWEGSGTVFEASARAEFPVGRVGRFATTLHYAQLTSVYPAVHSGSYGTWSSNYHYDYQDDDGELDYEFGPAEYPYGAGIGYLHESPLGTSSFDYTLHGTGVGLDKWPNYYLPVSIYASVWFYPNVQSTDVYAYDIWRYDTGLNVRFKLTSPFSLKFGMKDETWIARNTASKDYRFFGPYAGISWWR